MEIKKTAPRDTGTYRCMAANSDGDESTTCELVVDESKYGWSHGVNVGVILGEI